MTKEQHDTVVDAFKTRAEAEVKSKKASEILARELPDDGQAYAIPGTPYFASRKGDTLTIKTAPQMSISDLIK